jgi:enediyne polyketide synthase
MSRTPQNCPIAIVGMACRYPDADTVKQLFENSLAQRTSFRKIPDVRLSSGYFDDSGKATDRAYARQAAVIKGFNFDRRWFRVSQASYEVTDLTHWLALTVAHEAIQDIRFRKDGASLGSDAVRVVVGNTLTGEFSRANQMRLRWPYVRGVMVQHLRSENPGLDDAEIARLLRDLEVRYKKPFPIPNEDYLAGGLANTIAGRICNHFDFKGGGYTIDGACASSLLAVIDACSALVSGDADIALAGGVDLSIDPFELVGFSRTAALANNEMLVYDEQSEGFWPGEGCGFVALMRYEDAIEQCKHIHAVIQGWGISSDGRGGLTRPEAEGQMLALQHCYKRAGYGIETVGYFEGHGTGTKVGDSAELCALIAVRGNSGNAIQPAVISSIKANIGHTKAASGLAGLLRATMCISEKILPPTTGCRKPHALFTDNAGHLAPSDRFLIWESDMIARRAGVSAMGFGGINTHITIEEAPAPVRTSPAVIDNSNLARLAAFQDTELFLFSASRREDLAWTIDHIAGFANACSRAELTDLAAELARRAARGALSIWKAAVVAATPAELFRKLSLLKDALDRSDDNSVHLGVDDGVFVSGGNTHGRIGLIFSGQGAPARAQAGIHGRRFDEVRRIYQQANLDSFGNRDDTDFAQPAIVTASLGGLALLQRIGVCADVAIGHSLGELTALHWAGYFDTASLLAIARARGQAMVDDPHTSGAMAAITANHEQTVTAIGKRKNVFVANINSPRQTVVSGCREEIKALVAELRSSGVAATTLTVRQAFHTPLMMGVSSVFRGALNDVSFNAAERKIISTVTGSPLPTDVDVAAHLCDQLTSPVHFLAAASLAAQDVDIFLEIGPGDLMANLTHSFCATPVVSIDVGGKSLAPFLCAVAASYILGCAPEIANLFNDRFIRRFDWSWNPKFFQNPCEAIPEVPELEREVEPEAAKEVQVPLTTSNSDSSTCDRLRQITAGYTGLPIWTIQDNTRMLSDLHLNSITVGEIIIQMTASRGLPPPVDLTAYANASISEIAAALDQLEESGAGKQIDRRMSPNGVDTWVRYFEMTRGPAAPVERRRDLMQGKWEGAGKILQQEEALLQRLNTDPYGSGVIIWLSDNPVAHELPPLLQAAQRCIERARLSDEQMRFVVVQHGWGAGGFARSFFLENEAISTLVINLPPRVDGDFSDLIAQEINAAMPGFREITIDATGQREDTRLRLVKAPPSPSLALVDESDVVLISGGGKGICAECGYQLARKTGCTLLILGRSTPQNSVELANNLDRLRKAGLHVSYQQADVTDAADVAAAVTVGIAELGSPVTGIVHGAGLNHPCMVENLSIAGIKATVSPKVDGLRNLLAAVDPNHLKLMVNFSSIIARIGLPGEADYALGNEWLSRETEAFQSRHPHCRCRAIEWSVWSGAGMGQRLGRLEALQEQGILPISIDDGIQAFLRLLDTPYLPVSLIVSGRFGNPPTIVFDQPPLKLFRFIDWIPVYYPETELIAECRLSPKSDPYLDDHMLNGERLFPAVMALEAMSEAVVALMGNDAGAVTPLFHDVVFRKAIVVPGIADAEEFTLRVAVLADIRDDISLAIRCSATDFQVNHIEARCTLRNGTELRDKLSDVRQHMPADEIQPFDPDRALYQNVLFQKGRFKRIQGYHLIEARRCSGQLSLDCATQWFSQDLPQGCLIGDPGARDAALHAIQACIPHKIVIPISVEEIDIGVLDHCQSYRMFATEIADNGDELVYDLTIFDRDGQPIERWRRITLRVMGEPPNLQLNSPPLMAPFFERRVAASMPQAELKVSIAPTTNEQKKRTATVAPDHRPDGKPDPLTDTSFQSSAYSGDWKLTVNSVIPVGCDLQSVSRKNAGDWELMLGKEGFRLASVIARIVREQLDVAATRVWTARESMKKAGLAASAPLIVDPDSSAQWVVFNSGDSAIFSSVIDSTAAEAAICIAVALRHARRPLDHE